MEHRDKQELPEEITEREVKRFYYDLNDFDSMSPMAKGGMKDSFYIEVWPVAEWLMESHNAALKQLEEARKYDLRRYIPDGKYCGGESYDDCPLFRTGYCNLTLDDVRMPIDECNWEKSPKCPKPPIERS